MYNTKKQRLVEYVEEMVCLKLRDLTRQEMRMAKQKFAGQWEQVRMLCIPDGDAQQGMESNTTDDNGFDELDELDVDEHPFMDDDLDMD